MDPSVKEYIEKARNIGQSDEQIKEALLNKGWLKAQLEEYFPVEDLGISSEIKPQKLHKYVLLILVFLLGLFFLVGFYVYKNILKGKLQKEEVKVETAVQVKSNWSIAFIKMNKTSEGTSLSGDLVLYDIDKKETFIPALPNSDLNDFLPTLSPWSPNGRYIAMQAIRENSKPQPLYLFDGTTAKITKIFDVNEQEDLKDGLTGFFFTAYWPTSDYFVYRSHYDLTNDISTLYTVNLSGQIESKTGNKELLMATEKLEASYPLRQNISNSKDVKLKIDGKPVNIVVDGEIIGTTPKYLVAVKYIVTENFLDALGNPLKEASQTTNLNEEELKEQIVEWFKPKASPSVTLYLLENPTDFSTINLPFDGWATFEVQVVPNRDVLIMQEIDSVVPPYKYRYVRVNLDSLSSPDIISEEGGGGSAEQQMSGEGGFSITYDGKWLVGLQPDPENTSPANLTYRIVAWSIDNKERVVICESGCNSLRVYNPSKIRRK